MTTTAKTLRRVPKSTSNEEILKIVAEDGAVIIEQFLSNDIVEAFKVEMRPYIAARAPGSPESVATRERGAEPEIDQAWGHNTVRLTNLISRSETFRTKIAADEKLFNLASQQLASEQFWMSTAQVIYIGPGSLPQFLHRDLENYPVFTPLGPAAPEVTCNSIFAISDFTEINGATRVIPGSNQWTDDLDTAKKLPRHVQQMTGFRSFNLDNGARLWTADFASLAEHFDLDS